ncbi:MAG: hypothetical protein IPJ60_09500 [Sphingobacteriaceae bacterium]|nr:hypothetical protein [Sphingobacteriaceae bacterium]
MCTGAATLAGNTPAIGTGIWLLQFGSGVPTTPTAPNSALTGLSLGSNIFSRNITNGVCPVSTATVEIYRDNNPSLSNAGPNQTVCATFATLAGNTPAVGTGSWTLVFGSGNITTPTSPTSGLTALGAGINVFAWTVTNGSCPPSTSTVSIQRDLNPTVAKCRSVTNYLLRPSGKHGG